MLCKRMALALLLPLSLATMATLGCGGQNEPTPPTPAPLPSSEADIVGLEISVGGKPQALDPAVKTHTAMVGTLGESSIGVKVTLKDAKARLTLNGTVVASGATTNIALREGDNRIIAMVVAEDGRTDNTVTLNVSRLPFNTRVQVLNGIGGALVAGTKLKLTDSEGNVLADDVDLPKEKNGQVIFGLDPAKRYNIYAKGTNTAVSCAANFDPAKEDTATLYCLRNSTTYFVMEAPIIEEIAFATANETNADWKEMPNGSYYQGTAANMAAVRVTTLTRNLLSIADVSDYVPISIQLDEIASANMTGALGAKGDAIQTNVPVPVDGKTYYRSVHRFTTPLLTTAIFNKGHFLDVVVYDAIGNRTEQRVYLTITDSGPSALTDADLTNAAPSITYSQSQVYVGAGDLPVRPGDEPSPDAVDPVEPYPAYNINIIRFYVRDPGSSTNLGIRGFEVWRSNGNANNFVKIATRHYASPAAQEHSFTDRTPDLTDGKVFYRVRAFNGSPANNGYSPVSPVFEGNVMLPTTTRPAASHKAVQDKLWPTFRFVPSNPKMFAKGSDGKYPYVDRFMFTLFIKNTTNQFPFLLVPFRVYFEDAEKEKLGTANHRYGFALGKPPVEYMQVTSYTATTSAISGTWSYAADREGEGDAAVYTPFVYLDDDGSVVINTASKTFQTAMANAVRSGHAADVAPPYFMPGVTYLWNLFGAQGGIFWTTGVTRWSAASVTNAAYFTKGFNPAPNATAYLGVSIGSNMQWGLGSPEGWFELVITPDAK